MARFALMSLALAGALGLGACATDPGPYAYSPYEAGAISHVEEGTVLAVRPVVFDQQRRGSGALVGGAAGATIGSQFGGDSGGHLLGAVIGGMVGAVAGDAVSTGNARNGFAYTIRRQRDDSVIEIAQVEPQPLQPGTRVSIVYGDRVRVVPAGY